MTDFDNDEYESFDLDDADAAVEDDAVGQDHDDDDDDYEDDLEDADDDEVDFVIAAYREDGASVVTALSKELANDLEELVTQLRRLPGDAGALGFVSLVEEVFLLVRVRGQHVQVLLSDGAAAGDWPIARDVADYLAAEIPDEDESEPMGDLAILADLGVSEFDLNAMAENLDQGSDQTLIEIADKLKIGPQFRKIADGAFN